MSRVPVAATVGLVDGYEALRAAAVAGAGPLTPARGLTLLLRFGVPTWIATWTATLCTPAGARTSDTPAAAGSSVPVHGATADIAAVLASMALAACGG